MKRLGFAALCILLAAGFAGLGVWQVERRAWKHDLIAAVNARVHAPPRALRNDAPAYTRVRLRGTFRPGSETFVQAVTDLGPGWWVLTPLDTDSGTVLVNRGFAPERTHFRVAGPVTVTGLVRASEPGGAFLRSNDPAHDRWYSRDVAAIANARHLGTVAPVFVDADATANPGGLPVGGLTVIAFSDNHLIYALTWFALAGLSAFGAVMVLRRR
ncbi:SURF1 family protein [Sphingomonas immobilis]|uniref:SURF1-like protein n=1 Tax=Sphingomonas immobilis TaxID=3063997 RepID=A0ABT8ZT54_9SPHN|nr:SURF1 family protein [Sphingomonas sp. CA1-15]MDO7840747.1 SURF1 family protein [Sphingomonas sp. CA1-15]